MDRRITNRIILNDHESKDTLYPDMPIYPFTQEQDEEVKQIMNATLNYFPIEHARMAVHWNEGDKFISIGRHVLLYNGFAEEERLDRAADPAILDAERFVARQHIINGMHNSCTNPGVYVLKHMVPKYRRFVSITVTTDWGNCPTCYRAIPIGAVCTPCFEQGTDANSATAKRLYFHPWPQYVQCVRHEAEYGWRCREMTNVIDLAEHFDHEIPVDKAIQVCTDRKRIHPADCPHFDMERIDKVLLRDIARLQDDHFALDYVQQISDLVHEDYDRIESMVMNLMRDGYYNTVRTEMLLTQQRMRQIAEEEALEGMPIHAQVHPPEDEEEIEF